MIQYRNLSIVFILSFIFIPSSFGLDKKSSQAIRHKSQDLEKVKNELKKKRGEASKLEKETSQLQSEMNQGKKKASGIEKSIIMTRQKDRELHSNLAKSKINFDKMLGEIDQSRKNLGTSLGQYYAMAQLAPPTSPLLIYSKESLLFRTHGLKEKNMDQKEAKKNLETLIDTQETLRKELDRQKGYLTKIQSNLTQKKKILNKKKSRKEILASEMKDLEQTANELESLVDILRSKAKKEAAQEKKERRDKFARGQSPIASKSLPWPLRGKITEKFGRHTHPQWGTPYNSNGIVVITAKPKPIKSVGSGHVLFAGQFMSYGPMVLIEHPGDWYSVYGRLEKWSVEKGQAINKGDVIGTTGINDVGNAEVYFELRFYGKPTNPIPWLQK